MYKNSLPQEQVDYSNDPDFLKSFDYYNSIDEETKKLIQDYKSEIDPDDWANYPLKIQYSVANWMAQNWTPANITFRNSSENKSSTSLRRSTKNTKSKVTKPDLLSVITENEYATQIQSSIQLSNILCKFPKIKYNDKIVLYRGGGGPSPFTQVLRNNLKTKGNMFTIYSFISTSANKRVATEFTIDYFLYINIYEGMPLPFISNILSLNYNLNIGSDEPTSESEVLLPIGCTFKLISKTKENINGKMVDTYYVDLIKFGRPNTRHFNTVFKRVALNALKNIPKDTPILSNSSKKSREETSEPIDVFQKPNKKRKYSQSSGSKKKTRKQR
jgi:hypothetical protein